MENKEEFIKYLLDKISEVDLKPNERMKSAVHWICQSHSKRIVQMVLEKGIDVNRFDEKGQPGPYYLIDTTPDNEAIEILDLLVKYGYDLNGVCQYGCGLTILGQYLCSIKSCLPVIEWLLAHGADPFTPFTGTDKKAKNAYEMAQKSSKRQIRALFEKYVKH
ncbi:hypothetical protein TRFO_32527 [Tritrichomonas foetus]|uniref:Uncharacterized protein n=1 Tax=Tritrichomonas foetus TaxID=1144522 RepID=A0A1J4JT86_9EUKA|nr:hypothetical protein TRFO_32527 [Tritrichomonas foetus]|eukprot:OHT00708.1 hypothetical protein TRFO_32527 [Tritrichomonas foetus]